MCRNHKTEVATELEGRGDDVIRMIKAFYDQGEMVAKYLTFFRAAIEKSLPALLRQTLEPLPRVISFLEPYGEIQLSFLYEAAKDRAIKARLNEIEPRHLLEVTDKWVSRARNGKLAVIMAHKARVVVRHVASLDIDLAPPDRAVWMGMALWGSVPQTSEEVELMEDRIRKGAFYRGDPVEMMSIAERMADVHGLNDEMFQMIRLPLLEAMQKAGPEKAAEAFASLTFATGELRVPEDKAHLIKDPRKRKVKIWKVGEDKPVGKIRKKDPEPPPKPIEAFSLLLSRLMEAFTTVTPLVNLEIVLERWVAKNFHVERCEEVTRDVMLQRLVTEDNLIDPINGEESLATLAESPSILPGPLARCSSHLISLGLPGYTLAPAINWLLSQPAGWAEKKAYPKVTDPEDASAVIEKAMLERRGATTTFTQRSLPLLSHLWPDEEREGQDDWNMFPLRDADELLRLVGPTQEREDQRSRQADLAANKLLQRLAVQMMFPDLEAELEYSMRQWRETQPETTLSTIVAPWLLKAAQMCADTGIPSDEPSGVLARSIGLLAKTMKQEEISLLSAEWALGPFEEAEICDEAVALVSSSCAQGGVEQGIIESACSSWLDSGCTPGSLGVELAEKSLLAWERDGVHDEGVVHLRKALEYLNLQLELGMLTRAPAIEMRLKTASESLQVLIGAIDGVAPSLPQLNRAKEGIFSKLSHTGRSAMIDAVANAWSAVMPGLQPGVAAIYLDEWLQGSQSRRSLVELAATAGLQELKWNLMMKLDRTFASQQSEAYSSPSFRVEGIRKVPWFVPASVVKEAFDGKPMGLRKEPLPSQGPGFVRTKLAVQQAKDKSGGRCMYCGGAWKLSPRYFWPHELGGTEVMSNLSAACECCTEMAHALGPKRWGEVLTAKPEEAAEVWWEAQKKANTQTVSFLNPRNRP